MPDLLQPTLTRSCPDPQCSAPIGTPHSADCEVATCLETGQQRILHQHHTPAPPTGITSPHLHLVTHTCGEDMWTGQRHGVAECQEYDWFVRRAEPGDDPFTGWIPCPGTDPRAAPDLDRLARHATWSPTDNGWRRHQEVPGRG